MGTYDEFHDGKKSIQLKILDCTLRDYKKGDHVPLKEHAFPATACFLFVPYLTTDLEALYRYETIAAFKNERFIGIVPWDKAFAPIYDSHGNLLIKPNEKRGHA